MLGVLQLDQNSDQNPHFTVYSQFWPQGLEKTMATFNPIWLILVSYDSKPSL